MYGDIKKLSNYNLLDNHEIFHICNIFANFEDTKTAHYIFKSP